MNTAELRAAFDASLDRLAESDGSRVARRQAMAAFARRGFPTRRDEDWKYTDLKPILTGRFDPLPGTPSQGHRQLTLNRLSSLELAPDAPQLVFLGGQRLTFPTRQRPGLSEWQQRELPDSQRPALPGEQRPKVPEGRRPKLQEGRRPANEDSPGLPPGVEITDRHTAWRRIRKTQNEGQFREYPLTAINTAFSPDCTLIRVGANVVVDQPLHLIYLGGAAANSAAQTRLLIDLGANSRLCVVQHFAAHDGGGWTNSVTQATQEPGSELTLYRLQEDADDHIHTELLDVTLARDASAKLGYIDLGGRLVRNDLRVRLAEPGASCDISGVFLAARGQHVDNHTRIDHIAPRTTSNETFRGIVGERGRGVFNGKVVVHAGARGTDARQSSDNLLLSGRAEVDTKPELEIYTDDVKCAHGATVGELDAEQLFYLRSRGMDEETARGLLIFAFANDLLRRIEVPELRKRVVTAVAGHLPDYEHWGGLL